MRQGLLLVGGVLLLLNSTSGPAIAQEPLRERMYRNHVACDRGDRAACVRFGILIGENRERHQEWRREHREWWWWER